MGQVSAKESMGQQIPLGGIQAKVVAVNIEGLKRQVILIDDLSQNFFLSKICQLVAEISNMWSNKDLIKIKKLITLRRLILV